VRANTNLIIADPEDIEKVASDERPTSRFPGFACSGLDCVKLGALLSLLKGGWAGSETELVSEGLPLQDLELQSGEQAWVSAIDRDDVAELAVTAALEDSELDQLALDWGATESFVGWSEWEVWELLRRIGDLAEAAMLKEKCLVLRHGRF